MEALKHELTKSIGTENYYCHANTKPEILKQEENDGPLKIV